MLMLLIRLFAILILSTFWANYILLKPGVYTQKLKKRDLKKFENHWSTATGKASNECKTLDGLGLDHGRPQKFSRGGKVDILFIFFWLLAMQRKLTYTKKKMSNVTATVAYSIFLVRKLCTEQMFVLVSMAILRLSWQSSKWITNFMNFYNSVKSNENTNKLHI